MVTDYDTLRRCATCGKYVYFLATDAGTNICDCETKGDDVMPDMPITKKRLPLRQVEALERIAVELETSNELKRRFIEWMFQDLNGDIKTIAAALEKIVVSSIAGNPLDWPIEVEESIPDKTFDKAMATLDRLGSELRFGESWQIGDHQFNESEVEE